MSYLTMLLVISSASLHFAYAIDPAYKQMIIEAGSSCNKQYPVGDETIKDMFELRARALNENEKCFAGCMLEKLGIIKEKAYNAEFHKSTSAKKFKNSSAIEKANQVIDSCKDKVLPNDDICELGYEIIKCLISETKKVGLEAPPMDSEMDEN